MIKIEDLWCPQRNLRIDNVWKLKLLQKFDTKIELHRCVNDEIQINDGHHRLVVIWLSGKRWLDKDQYVICDVEKTRKRLNYKIPDLIKIYGI